MLRAVTAAAVLCCSLPALAGGPPGMTDPVGSQPAPALQLAPGDDPGVTPPGMAPLREPAQPIVQPHGVESYRLQTLAADGLALALLVAAANSHGSDGDKTAQLGLGTYLLGAPLVHAAHGRTSRALGSLAMRVGIPIAAAYVGAGLASRNDSCSDCNDSALGGAVFGLMLGMVTAATLDTALLAKGDELPAPPRFAPSVAPTQGGMSFGVAGSF
jgi:hypothetical protein